MAATTTAYEAEIVGFAPSERGLCAGMAYKLRQNYLQGMVDPAAHTAAKGHAKQVAMTNSKNQMASFDAIAAPRTTSGSSRRSRAISR
jgi:hypothetical protein